MTEVNSSNYFKCKHIKLSNQKTELSSSVKHMTQLYAVYRRLI